MKKDKKKKINKKQLKTRNTTISKRKIKRRRLRYGRIILCLIIIGLIVYLLATFIKFPIKNIYISGNNILKDQEIIDLAGIQDYPSIFSINEHTLKRKLKKNPYIEDVKLSKKNLREVHIKITENYPLFYYESKKITVMHNLKKVKEELNAPYVVNYIVDNVYDLFMEKMQTINKDILSRVSEIKYDPNSVDEERFLFTMNDGNYVYLTLEKFNSINSYVDIIKNFENKKGILYLDSGEYFKVF